MTTASPSPTTASTYPTAPITAPGKFPSPPPAIPGNVYDDAARGRPGPTWYGQAAAREDRSWLSATGDIDLIAGRTFPTAHDNITEAIQHSLAASDADHGAVAVFHKAGKFHLARLYNAEFKVADGLRMHRTQLAADHTLTHLHAELRAVTDEVGDAPQVLWQAPAAQ